ncbi:MAG: hypothetical protein A3H32_12800 [Betaproteobacteria bacterium RIFCSPLOWO2_02_FULL_63_19]|nr:MAG: hypothetical protein A3H32_12800 [Betaproteobacteria bacterium RIFCSPLOWO2_02_FULL_63_19]
MANLIDALRSPRCYPHAVTHLHVVETHISWVVLTGRYAYKIKKPVNLGFLDFRTLEARRFYCEEELRLNRRLTSDLYLEVVAITGSIEHPSIGGHDQILEYAVKMRQFDEGGLLDRVQARGGLLAAHVDDLARTLAAFHRSCRRAPSGARLGSPESVLMPMHQNFVQVSQLISAPGDRAPVERLRQWSDSMGGALQKAFAERQKDGYVRECHGDLHLGNVFLENGTVRIFDCIEFDANLRWIDVMSEVAFLVMDLRHRDHPELACRFLNAYLEFTGDYSGLVVLPFYLTYRAMVRAKIALIRSAQPNVRAQEIRAGRTEYGRYIGLAEEFSADRPRWLALTHGYSGSGKSHFSQQLLERCNAVRIRSDTERKRGHGLERDAASRSPVGGGLYTEAAAHRNYERLARLTALILEAGWPVIVDGAFLLRWQRDLLLDIARRLDVPWLILHCQASEAMLRQRLAERARSNADPSEATQAVLEFQIRTGEPLTDDERGGALVIDPHDKQGLVRALDRIDALVRRDTPARPGRERSHYAKAHFVSST